MKTVRGAGGIVTAPHRSASKAGLSILKAGGNAAEAAVAIAAALAVVYPHMNSIGGDSFWLHCEPGQEPVGIDACGRAAQKADLALYEGRSAIPWRGPLAANTVAGTVSGWAEVLRVGGGRLPLAQLLEPAITYAEDGAEVTAGYVEIVGKKFAELEPQPGFAQAFLPRGRQPSLGDVLRQPALAQTLRTLANEGLDSFYRGPLAEIMAADLEALGSPLRLADLHAHRAEVVEPLRTQIGAGTLYNMPPPTQGLASLLILALFDRLGVEQAEGFDHIHGLVEATKQAFKVRDRHVGDPAYMDIDPQALLDDRDQLAGMATAIDRRRAAPWPSPISDGDTVWFGVIDGEGRTVSAIQSTYFEFGSGLVLPRTGVTWQNRGASFRLVEQGWNALRPGRKPFHTLNPAMAVLSDGRTMAYGNMGGEGQPQSQAAIFSRYAMFGEDLQDAITAPRWLLGRTWGEDSTSLKLESRFDPELVNALRQAGHSVELAPAFTDMMGHAGALVRWADGTLEGASDPRSDGAALVMSPARHPAPDGAGERRVGLSVPVTDV
ncbi:MAG TPA: gamma-glutamyltransferase family protein [Caulobacteraceae bacterium]|nr:gamma-glutamyltransferase family protein [Caulobacteraceae bacterium]